MFSGLYARFLFKKKIEKNLRMHCFRVTSVAFHLDSIHTEHHHNTLGHNVISAPTILIAILRLINP